MGEGFTIINVSLLGILGLAFLILAITLKRKKYSWAGGGSLILAVVFLFLAALLAILAIATQGYRALVREEIAATVKIIPIGPSRFQALFHLADGRKLSFNLAGEEIYVDAHILKWKPLVNILGLHTSYELDRVAGRYVKIEDEKSKERTVFTLSPPRAINLFSLRQKYVLLKPLLDVEYGSATFIAAQSLVELEIRVSTSGLLIRKKKEDHN